MSDSKWSRLSTDLVLETPYFSFRHDRYVLPRGGSGDYFYVDVHGAAMVVPELPNGELVLVRQYRYLHQRPSLEFPGGGVRRGGDALGTAHGELQEEAGLLAGRMDHIGAFAPYNGASNEMCQVYLARDLRETAPRPDATEELSRSQLSVERLQQQIASGELWDGMTLSALQIYLLAAR